MFMRFTYLLWFPTKTKNFCFLPFIDFLFFAKNSGAKKQKIEIDHIFEFFSIFPNFFWNFWNFFKEKSIYRDFFEKFQENRPKFGIFSFSTDILVILFKKIWICIIIRRNKSAEIFYVFFVFCLQKTPIFFCFLQKIKIQKKWKP